MAKSISAAGIVVGTILIAAGVVGAVFSAAPVGIAAAGMFGALFATGPIGIAAAAVLIAAGLIIGGVAIYAGNKADKTEKKLKGLAAKANLEKHDEKNKEVEPKLENSKSTANERSRDEFKYKQPKKSADTHTKEVKKGKTNVAKQNIKQ